MTSKSNGNEVNNFHYLDNMLIYILARKWFLVALLCVVLFFGSAFWLELKEQHVNDFADILNEQEEQSLELLMQWIQQKNGVDIAVVTVPDLEWRDPFEVTFNFAQYQTDTPDDSYKEDGETGVGSKDADDWFVLMIAPNDRKRYAMVWRWLEWVLTDAYLKRIGENTLPGNFRNEQYYEWITRFIEVSDWVIEWNDYIGEIDTRAEDSEKWMNILLLWVFLSFMFGSIFKPSLKTEKQKFTTSWVASWGYAWLAALWLWWTALFMVFPLLIVWLIILFGENKWWWTYGWWWFSWWWSFGWGFGWFGWGSFSGGWAWWWR